MSGNGVFEQLATLSAAATRPEFFQRIAQAVLGPGPILRQVGLGLDLKGGATSNNRLFKLSTVV
jgi:hypothetical protein